VRLIERDDELIWSKNPSGYYTPKVGYLVISSRGGKSWGGFINDREGNEENSFEWRLGKATNNQVEALSLFQDMRVVDERCYGRFFYLFLTVTGGYLY
jgi:hypothetical protein